jgi:hypothetical protein
MSVFVGPIQTGVNVETIAYTSYSTSISLTLPTATLSGLITTDSGMPLTLSVLPTTVSSTLENSLPTSIPVPSTPSSLPTTVSSTLQHPFPSIFPMSSFPYGFPPWLSTPGLLTGPTTTTSAIPLTLDTSVTNTGTLATPTASSQTVSAFSDADKVGLGVGLGIGIPLLIFAGIIAFILWKSSQQAKHHESGGLIKAMFGSSKRDRSSKSNSRDRVTSSNIIPKPELGDSSKPPLAELSQFGDKRMPELPTTPHIVEMAERKFATDSAQLV